LENLENWVLFFKIVFYSKVQKFHEVIHELGTMQRKQKTLKQNSKFASWLRFF